jgi:hypothetical protein
MYLSVLGDRSGVNLEDFESGGFVGQRNLDFSIQTTGSEEGRVQGVRTIGGHDHFDLKRIIQFTVNKNKLDQGFSTFWYSRTPK